MLDLPINRQDEHVNQLQAQLAVLKQENAKLQAALEGVMGSPLAKHLQLLEGACDPAHDGDGGNSLTLEPRLLAATAMAANALLSFTPLDSAVNAALQILGEALDTDRVTVIENFDNPSDSSFIWWRLLYEWTSSYAIPQITHPDLAQGSYEGIEEWYTDLSQGQGISCLLEDMSEPFRSGQAVLGLKALHFVPIFVECQYWGAIGFDDCREVKHRSPAELAVLKIAADCIGSAIQRQRIQQATHRAEQEFVEELRQLTHDGQQSYRLLSVVAQITKDLLETEDVNTAILAALQAVGNVANMSRVLLILERQAPGTQRLTHYVKQEWTAPEILDHAAVGMMAMDNEGFQVLIQPLYMGRSVWYVIDELPEATRTQFEKLNIQSTGVVPIFIEGRYVGCVGFDDCVNARQWSQQEINVLTAAAESIGAALHRQELVDLLIVERIGAEQVRSAALEKVNEVLRQRSDDLQRSYRILEATAQATDALLTIENLDQAVNTALRILGESLETDRTKVLESLSDDASRPFSRYHNLLYEWTSPSTIRQLSHTRQVDTRGQMEGFFEGFLQTNGFGGLLEEWDESLQAALQALGVKSLYVVPIWVNEQWWGILAFDDCREAKHRTPAEMAVLRTVANCLGSAIQRQRRNREYEEANQQVLLEREEVALERATELLTVNDSLRLEVMERHRAERSMQGQSEALVGMLTAFAAAPVLDNFLGIVLRKIVEQLGGHAGSIWLYDEAQNTTLLHLNYEDGQIQQGSQIAYSGRDHNFLRQWSTDYMPGLRQQKILIQDLQQFANNPAYEVYYTHNQQHGIKTILVAALFFGETLLGSIILRCTQHYEYKSEDLALIRVLTHQAALAIQLTRLAEQGKQAAISEERNRIAREIHDTLAQSFTSIRMQLEAALRLLTRNPEQAQACITLAQDLAKTGLAAARRSVWALQPEAEDYRHLSTTLERLAAQQTAETSIQVEVEIVGTPYALPSEVGMNLLRIGQEALNNAIRHASAQTILTLTYAPHQIQLQIQDDGQGFDPLLASSGGFGLIGMQQRSDRLGGTFTLSSQLGRGTEVRITVPILERIEPERTPIN